MMTNYLCSGVDGTESAKEIEKAPLLLGSSGISELTSFVAYTNGTGVES